MLRYAATFVTHHTYHFVYRSDALSWGRGGGFGLVTRHYLKLHPIFRYTTKKPDKLSSSESPEARTRTMARHYHLQGPEAPDCLSESSSRSDMEQSSSDWLVRMHQKESPTCHADKVRKILNHGSTWAITSYPKDVVHIDALAKQPTMASQQLK